MQANGGIQLQQNPIFYVPAIYVLPPFETFLSGPFNFPIFTMHGLPRFYVSKISNFPQFFTFTSLESLKKEEF
jgi:hypothetical protein